MLALNNTLSADIITDYKPYKSLRFDGGDAHVQTNQAFSFTNHSIFGWIKMIADTDNKTIIDIRDANGDGILIFLLGNEKLRYVINDADLDSPTAVTNSWTHFACTYDGTTAKMFINASLVRQETHTKTISTSVKATIGARSFSTPTNFFFGNMLQLTGLSRALSSSEITSLYNGGKPVNPMFGFGNYNATNLQFCYLFGNGNIDRFGLIANMKQPAISNTENAVNGDFSKTGEVTNTSHSLGFRTPDSGITIQANGLNLTNASGGGFDGRVNFSNGTSALTLTIGAIYKFTYTIVENSENSALAIYDGAGYNTITNTVGTHSAYYVYNSNDGGVWLRNQGDGTTVIFSFISLKEVLGGAGAMEGMISTDLQNDTP